MIFDEKNLLGSLGNVEEIVNLDEVISALSSVFTPIINDANSARKDKISLFDLVIRRLYTLISAVKIHRNSLVPISALPDEVLGLIFEEYARQQGSISTLGWTKVMLVCRGWYSVATSRATLWSHIEIGVNYNGDYRRLETQISRSRQCPLNVQFSSHTESDPVLTDLILPHSSRLKSLSVNCPLSTAEDMIKQFCRSNLSSLQSFVCESAKKSDEPIPDAILNLPSLRYLQTNFNINWATIHALTTLKVGFMMQPMDTRPSFREFMLALQNCPFLEVLEMKFSLPAPPVPINEPTRLASLRTLDLRDDLSNCVALLHSIEIPPTCQVILLPFTIHTETGGEELFTLMTAQVRYLKPSHIQSFRISDTRRIRLTAYADAEIRNNSAESAEGRFREIIFYPSSPQEIGRLVQRTAESWSATQATLLDVSYAPETMATERMWGRCFSIFRNLNTVALSIDDRSAISFCSLLLKLLGVQPNGNVHRPQTLPKLEKIRLSDLYHGYKQDINTYHELLDETLDNFAVVFQRYVDLDVPLPVLHVVSTVKSLPWFYITKICALGATVMAGDNVWTQAEVLRAQASAEAMKKRWEEAE